MRIGIIGAGHIGGTLTRRLTALGHDVEVANSRGPETLADLARDTGAKAVRAQDAVRDKDLVIITIPERAIDELPEGLFADAPADMPIVDTGNYYPQRDGRIAPIEDGTPESDWVGQRLGHPVIKAFNTIYAKHLMELGKPEGDPGRLALPVSGDDATAKRKVIALIEDLGFDAVDAGPLSDSWKQQPGTPVYGADLDAPGVKKALSEASSERRAEFRAK
jgi:8-hydroxy-5-deazaflavin:NADPH oxidoreductase